MQSKLLNIRNTNKAYGLVSILLHWLMAVLVILVFIIGWYMVELDYYDPWYTRAPDWHKALGMLVLVLLLYRIYWRYSNPRPQHLENYRRWEKQGAWFVHMAFYLLMLLLSVTGYLISTAKGAGIDILGWFTIPAIGKLEVIAAEWVEAIHYYAAYSIIALLILHTLAALKHHFIDRDITLKRILSIKTNEE